MTWHNKVIWTEGMFLQPQHFQQQDRFVSRLVDARVGLGMGHAWGFHSLAIDEAALHQGKLALAKAVGVFRDGTPFALPMDDPSPLAIDVPPDARDERVMLCLALSRPGVAESDVEGNSGSMPTRFTASEIEVADGHAASLRQAPLQIARLNLRLMLERDTNDGFSCIGVARVTERRADGRVVLDTRYMPPLMHVVENAVADGFVREIIGLLHQRAEALAATLAQPGRAGVGEIADFLLLQVCNRYEPQLVHMRQQPVFHAESLFNVLLGLAGELATFSDTKRPSELLPYSHDDPAPCFIALMNDLRQSLSLVRVQSAIPIELQERKHGIRVAVIPDFELLKAAAFVLAVNAQISSEQLRARFPGQVKIGPVERFRDLISLQLPGVGVRPLPVAPRQIPFHAGFSYFELDTQGNDMWRELETSAGLAIHLAGDFPALELELWAIRS
ncbi:type VI secretion system baseplate subunit TssK [Ramlibacter sp. WS9]|uniref:type VI secretion system baseplate subunit TssK n=1 Tax=Ramlibacter sp. WS9 TaxID=1882741 RepID=UPI00114197D2|nr:type VI secretion system baseplate subunit TssK [Ramlibacter sp. WS9]ROZ78304.1 type VI secretion system baseplate subunit TssK [Ramlibacter sp. WS9]